MFDDLQGFLFRKTVDNSGSNNKQTSLTMETLQEALKLLPPGPPFDELWLNKNSWANLPEQLKDQCQIRELGEMPMLGKISVQIKKHLPSGIVMGVKYPTRISELPRITILVNLFDGSVTTINKDIEQKANRNLTISVIDPSSKA